MYPVMIVLTDGDDQEITINACQITSLIDAEDVVGQVNVVTTMGLIYTVNHSMEYVRNTIKRATSDVKRIS